MLFRSLPDAVEVIARIRYHSRGYLNLLEREAHLARITWLAEHDPLTGCLNRRTWYDRLVQAAGVTPYEHNLAVAICDIDFFKKVNDTYGPLCGDEALKHFVGILKERLDNLGTLGRLGGEEFGIFMVLPTSMHQNLLKDNQKVNTEVTLVRGQVQDQADLVEGNRRSISALDNKVKNVEESIDVFDRYRQQVNQRLLDLQNQIQTEPEPEPEPEPKSEKKFNLEKDRKSVV